MIRRFSWLVVLLAACGGSSDTTAAPPPDGPVIETCAPGELRGANDAACVKGGWATCPEGSTARASGWGCEAVVAPKACTGASRDAYGSATCVPIGDCLAPFPSPDATLIVDAAGGTDSTHFTKIGDAITAASPGAVIAVAPGSYVESLFVTKDVTLVGRCAEQVKLVGFVNNARGIRVEGGAKVTASGFTITKQIFGVSVGPDSSLTLTDSVLDTNSDGAISLSDGTGTFTGARLAVRDTKESIDGTHGIGLNAQGGSIANVTDSSFTGNHDTALRFSTSAVGTLDRLVIRDGQPARVADEGRGIVVQDGAKVTMTRAALVDNYDLGIVAGDGTTVDLEDVFVGRTRISKTGEFGRALDAFGGAKVHAKRFHAYDNHDASVIAVEAGTEVTLESSSIVDTAFEKSDLLGRAITVQQGATVDVIDSALTGSREVAVAVFNEGSRVSLTRSIITGTAMNGEDAFGHGAMAAFGSLLEITDSEIATNAGTGIAIGDASARLARVRIRQNAVGLFVQDGTALRESDDAVPGPLEVTVTSDTVFDANTTRVSSGIIPLPGPSTILGP